MGNNDRISLMLDSMITAVEDGFSYDGIVSVPETGLEDIKHRPGLAGLLRDGLNLVRRATKVFHKSSHLPQDPAPNAPTHGNNGHSRAQADGGDPHEASHVDGRLPRDEILRNELDRGDDANPNTRDSDSGTSDPMSQLTPPSQYPAVKVNTHGEEGLSEARADDGHPHEMHVDGKLPRKKNLRDDSEDVRGDIQPSDTSEDLKGLPDEDHQERQPRKKPEEKELVADRQPRKKYE